MSSPDKMLSYPVVLGVVVTLVATTNCSSKSVPSADGHVSLAGGGGAGDARGGAAGAGASGGADEGGEVRGGGTAIGSGGRSTGTGLGGDVSVGQLEAGDSTENADGHDESKRIVLLDASDRSMPPSATASTPPITPRWAFEPWVWEDNTNTRQSTESIVTAYLSRQIPVGAVIIDSPWESTYNTLLWDANRYPNASDMIAGFHAMNVKVLLWITAFIDTDSDLHSMVKQLGYGVNGGNDAVWWKGTGIHIDVTNAAAANWWTSRMGAILAEGIDGWKLDRGADYIGDPVQTSLGSMPVTDFKKRLSALFFDYTTSLNPNAIVCVRPFDQAQGGIGSDLSKCSVGWVGDHDGSFAGIGTQKDDIYTSAQMGYGAPGVEVGGYTGNVPTKNSLIRYAEFGAVTALMENGGANGGLQEHLPWTWDTSTVDIYRYFATLHSELGPYNFSYGVEAHLTGTSILRGTDKALAQHRLGEAFFASVITSDVTSKTTLFPANANWIDYWNENNVFAGGTTTNYSAPLDRYPLFIRAGAIVPMDVKTAITGHGDVSSAGKVTLLVYPSSKSSFVFHRPLGEGTAYSDVVVDVDAVAGTITVTGSLSVAYRLRVKTFQAPIQVVGADTWSYDAVAKVVVVDKQAAAFSISITGLKGYP